MDDKKLESFYDGINEKLGDLYENSGYQTEEIEDLKKLEEQRYVVGGKIAEGGMKYVFEAEDQLTKRIVAKGVLKEDKNTTAFLKEIKILAKLEHSNIVPLYDLTIDDNNRPSMIMKLLGGYNFRDFLKRNSEGATSYSQNHLLGIFMKVCDALSYAHSRGVIHADIKPENIQIDDFGEVLLCDWGLAIEFEDKKFESISADGNICGSPGFMAPEQISAEFGDITPRTDIYALGALLYTILSGKSPFEDESIISILKKTVEGEVSDLASFDSIPMALKAVIKKAMSLNPQERYKNVDELQLEIVRYLDGFATEAEEAGPWNMLRLFIKRNKALCATISLAAVMLVMAFSYFFIRVSLSEKTAIFARNQAMEAKNAVMTEKAKLLKVSQAAAPKFFELGKDFHEKWNFPDAKKHIEMALKLDPDYREAFYIHAVYLLMDGEYEKAVDFFSRHSGKSKPIVKKVQKLISGEMSKEEFILKMFENKRFQGIGPMYAKYIAELAPEERFAFAKRAMKRCTYTDVPVGKVKYNVDKAEMTIKDYSLASLVFLCGLGVRDLSLVNCESYNTTALSALEFDNLYLIKCNFVDFDYLDLSVSKKLSLKDSKINSPRIFMYVNPEEIDISGTSLTRLGTLPRIKNLKVLTLTKEQKELANFSRRIKLILVD